MSNKEILLDLYPISSSNSRLAHCSALSLSSILPAGNSIKSALAAYRYCLIKQTRPSCKIGIITDAPG